MKKIGPIYMEKYPSDNNDNYGYVTPKWLKHFIDEITGEKYSITDLEEKTSQIIKIASIYRPLRISML